MPNLGFETEDATNLGFPEDWTITHQSRFEKAAYGTDPSLFPSGPVETFETEWTGTPYRLILDGGDIEFAAYGATFAESFESGWSNDGYVSGDLPGSSTEFAIYDTGLEAFEDFEEEWDNDGYVVGDLPGGSQELAQYDVALDEFEDFEEEWDNDGYVVGDLPGGSQELAIYDASVAGETVEDFEEVRPIRQMTVFDVATNELFIQSHGLAPGDFLSFENQLGRLPTGISETFVYEVNTAPSANTITIKPPGSVTVVDIVDFGFGFHEVKYDQSGYWVTRLDT